MKTTVFKKIREKTGLSQLEFAKSIGLEQGSYSGLESGKKGSLTKQTALLLKLVYRVNMDYLYGVSDKMFEDDSSEKVSEDNIKMLKGANVDIPVVNYERRGSPYYNVDFIGGFDIVMNDQTRLPDYYIDFEPYNRDGVKWCNISGHSMEPEINNGDFIAIRKVEDWQNFITLGEIYAIITTNGLRTVKRIRKGSSPDTYLLVPSNADYDTQEIRKDMIFAIFEVMGGVKKF